MEVPWLISTIWLHKTIEKYFVTSVQSGHVLSQVVKG